MNTLNLILPLVDQPLLKIDEVLLNQGWVTLGRNGNKALRNSWVLEMNGEMVTFENDSKGRFTLKFLSNSRQLEALIREVIVLGYSKESSKEETDATTSDYEKGAQKLSIKVFKDKFMTQSVFHLFGEKI